MEDKKSQDKLPDASTFLDEHGMLIADRLKEYEEAMQRQEKDKDTKNKW